MLSFILGFFDELLKSLFIDTVKNKITSYLDRRNVERVISRASETPAQTLEGYFKNENIAQEKVEFLLEIIRGTISAANIDAKMLASASLDAEKLTNIILNSQPIPKEIKEDELEWQYQMAIQIIADALCNIGPRFSNWEREAWSRSFDSFDKLLESQEIILKSVGPGGEGTLDDRFEHTYKSHILRKLAQIDASTFRVSSSLFLDLTTVFVEPNVTRVEKSNANLEATVESITTLEEARKQILGNQKVKGQETKLQAELFISKHRRCALVGLPGSGKTTLLQHVLLLIARGDRTFNDIKDAAPIFLKVRQLNLDDLPNVDELLQTAEGKVFAGARPGYLRRQFEKGKVVFLLDGLDEAAEEKRPLLLDWISSYIDLYPDARYIITSRPAGFQSDFFRNLYFEEAILSEFDDDQIQDYTYKWSKAVAFAEGCSAEEADQISRESANTLISSVKRNPYVRRIATNPLMLSTLCLVQRYEGGELPNRRVVLYQRCVEGLLFHWDNKRNLPTAILGSVPLEKKMLLLRCLAIEMQCSGVAEIKASDLQKSFENSLKEIGEQANAEEILENIRDRSGLLVERRPSIYGFSHLTFQEYLAALSINQADNKNIDRMFLFSKRADSQWREVIALYSGVAPRDSVESLIRKLIDTKSKSLIPLCGECLASSQNPSAALQEFVINKLLRLSDDFINQSEDIFIVQRILETLDETIVYKCVFKNLRNLDVIHPTRYLFFKTNKVAIKPLTEAGIRILRGKQKPAKWDYGITLILLLTENIEVVDSLGKLTKTAQASKISQKEGRVLLGLFSSELWRHSRTTEHLPGLFRFLGEVHDEKTLDIIGKYIL